MGMLGMSQEVPAGGLDDSRLLVVRDGGLDRAVSAFPSSVTYFHEHQRLSIQHHEIDLTEPAVEVAGQEAQPLSHQITAGQSLGPLSLFPAIALRHRRHLLVHLRADDV